MSKLETLIQQLCPDGVEYKKLGDIATITRGGNLQKKDFTDTGIPCIHYGQIYTKYGLFADKTFTFISEQSASKQKYAEPNDIVMAVTSENLEDVCKCVAWLGDVPAAVSGHTAIIHHSQNPKYLCYYFHSSHFQNQKNRMAHGTKVIEVTPNKLTDILLPIPPLEIQHEIVRNLDRFRELNEELTTQLSEELAVRKKQYGYYTSILIGGEKNNSPYQYVQLSKVANFVYGFTDKAKNEGDARFLRITDIDGNGCLKKEDAKYITLTSESRKYMVHKGDLLMARTGATYGKTLYVPDDKPAIYASFLIKICLDNSIILNRFYWHFAQSNLYWDQAAKLVSKGGQPQFNSGAVGRILVPVPSLNEQRRIISVLDRFYTLCNDLTSGLPAEIAARQKQYEYYRDKLLTFKEITKC